MGADGIAKFEYTLFLPNSGSAQKHMRFDSHILNFFHTDDLVNIDPQQLMIFVFQS